MIDQKTKFGASLALAGAFAAALSMASAPASAQTADDPEKCFGISKAGENDCSADGGSSCAGQSTIDYDGLAWKLVKKGTCTSVETPVGLGSLEPIPDRGKQG